MNPPGAIASRILPHRLFDRKGRGLRAPIMPNNDPNTRPHVPVNGDNDPVRQVIIELEDLLVKKGRDYAAHGSTWTNFDEAATFAGITSEQGIEYMIGTKLSRLESLKSQGGQANFESYDDTIMDLVGYMILYIAYRRTHG